MDYSAIKDMYIDDAINEIRRTPELIKIDKKLNDLTEQIRARMTEEQKELLEEYESIDADRGLEAQWCAYNYAFRKAFFLGFDLGKTETEEEK